jgi:hypothetical protein
MDAHIPAPAPEDLGLFTHDPATPPGADPDGQQHGEREQPGERQQAGDEQQPWDEQQTPGGGARRHRRPNRRPVIAGLAAVAVAATVSAVVFGTELLSGGSDETLRPDGRIGPTAVLPTGDGGADTGLPSASPSSASGSPSTGPSATSSESPTESSSASPSRSTGGPGAGAGQGGGPVLSQGSSGPEVQELQLRLEQAGVYRPKADGSYDEDVASAVSRYQRAHGISGDPDGVYGANTRRLLESQTSEP